MIIEYLGHSCFYIQGEGKSVVTDPFAEIGYDLKRVSCDYCTISHEHYDHNNYLGVDAARVIKRSENGFIAIDSYHDGMLGRLRGNNRIFKFSVDGVTFCHLGDLGECFSQSLAEEIGETDVLFIPVGGTYTIDYMEAIKFAKAINAKITVPMHYKTKNCNIDIDGVENFLKRMPMVEKVGKTIELKRETLPDEPSVYYFGE